jgi:hypothetical protein
LFTTSAVAPSGLAPISGAPSAAAAAAAAVVSLEALATDWRTTGEARAGRAPAGQRAGPAPGLFRVLRRSECPVAPISGSESVVAGVLRPGPRIPGAVPCVFAVADGARIRRAGSGRSTGPGSGTGLVASLSLP